MLLIAIPKSASTALMETLARAHNRKCDMHRRWPGEPSREFPKFHIQHSFGWELDIETAEDIVLSSTIYKLHILPSINNQDILRKKQKVILLRAADEIVGAYKRGQETGVYRQKSDIFSDCHSYDEWINRAKDIGLYKDLENFSTLWSNHDGNKLVIHFDDLCANPDNVISNIEDYWRLPRSGTKELLKRKYTRLGSDSYDYHLETKTLWKSVGQSTRQRGET